MGTLNRFVILAICGSVFLPDTTSQGYYYENVNKYNLVNGRIQLVPPPPPPSTTTPEPTLMETIFPWMGDAYDSSKTPEEDAAILNSISDDPMTSSSNVATATNGGSSSWFTLPGFGSLTSDSEQHEVYEQPPNYPQQGMYNMYYPNQNPMGAASQTQPIVMPGPDQQGFMPSQQGSMPPQKGPMSPHQGHMSPEQAPMPHQHAPMPHQQSQMPHQQAQMSHQQGQMPPHQSPMPPQQQLPPAGPVYPGVKAPEPEHHMQIPYTRVPNHPAMTEPEPEKMHPQQSQQMPMYSPMYVSEQEKPNPYQGQQYPSYMAAQPQSPPQYPYRTPIQGVPSSGKIPYNFHQQVQDSIPLPGPYGLSGFNQQMFPYPYSANLPYDQGQSPNFPAETTEKSVSFWEMLTNYFTFGKRNDLDEMLTEDNFAVARSMVEDELEQTKSSDDDEDATDAEDESSAAEEDDDDTSSLKDASSTGTDSTGGKSDKEFPCPKTGIWKWNGDVCIAVGPVPVWACRPNDLIVSGKIAICRNKIYFSPQKIIQNLGAPN